MDRLVPPRSPRGFFIVVGSVADSPALFFFIRDVDPARSAISASLLQQKAARQLKALNYHNKGIKSLRPVFHLFWSRLTQSNAWTRPYISGGLRLSTIFVSSVSYASYAAALSRPLIDYEQWPLTEARRADVLLFIRYLSHGFLFETY